MEVILLQDVRNVGQRNDVKNVADGYAMNFLFPRKLAEAATKERVIALSSAREAKEAKQAADDADLAGLVQSLEGSTVVLTARATPKGGLFKAVGARDIARAIEKNSGRSLPHEAVILGAPLKSTGTYSVLLEAAGKRAHLSVQIAPAA